jgi:cysteine desulfurase/selenocysteine lyase
MDSSRSLPAADLPRSPTIHAPSAEAVARIADRFLREAEAAVPITAVPPGTLPPAAVPHTPPHSGNPAVDYSGLKAFVAAIRGIDGGRAVDSADPRQGVSRFAGSRFAPTAASFPAAFPSGGLFDVEAVRRDFPILAEKVHGRPLAWFDNAATTQKPQAVIDSLARFYAHDNSNIHRGAHTLAARATDAYEGARRTVADFLGAPSPDDIIFVRGCTEGINLVANACGALLEPGDEIVLTELEHHANIVPWQMVAQRSGARIRVAPIDDSGEVILEAYAALLGPRTRIVSFSHASNSLGTILPAETMTAMARAVGARVVVDGAQSVSHFPVDVRAIGCDFYVFSGHKIFGPTGIGAVYATADAQARMPPWQGGGNMIRDVTFAHTAYADPPAKFEAGTPNIADAIGLAAALDYVTRLGRPAIAAYEHDLLVHATRRLSAIEGLRLVGTAREKVGVLSFVLPDRDVVEIGQLLDREGFAVRAGHHCAQPSLRHFGLEATVRPSLAFYNTHAEIDRLAAAITRIARSPARPAGTRHG